jgi:hypothetical protein
MEQQFGEEPPECLIAEWEAIDLDEIWNTLVQQQNITRENPVGIKELAATNEKVDREEFATEEEALMARVESDNFSSNFSARLSLSLKEQIIGNFSGQHIFLAGGFKERPAIFSVDDRFTINTQSEFDSNIEGMKERVYRNRLKGYINPLYWRDSRRHMSNEIILSKAGLRTKVDEFDKRIRFKTQNFPNGGRRKRYIPQILEWAGD